MTEHDEGVAEPPEALGRRRFVQRMAAEATGMAGRAQGLSQVLIGSISAAGQAVVDDLEMIRAREAGSAQDAAVADSAPAVADIVPAAPAAAKSTQALLGGDQLAVLAEAREAVVAVNDPTHGPHLGVVAIAWNGSAIVFAAIGHSLRATLLRSDDRLALTIDGQDDTYLIVRGRAKMLAGAAAREALVARLVGTDRDWDELVAEDPDRLAVLLTPDQALTVRKAPR